VKKPKKDFWIKYEPGALLQDKNFMRCGYEAKGLWTVMWNNAFFCDPVGVLPGNLTQLKNMGFGSEGELAPIIQELERNGVFSRGSDSEFKPDNLPLDTIISRRTYREGKAAVKRQLRNSKGGVNSGKARRKVSLARTKNDKLNESDTTTCADSEGTKDEPNANRVISNELEVSSKKKEIYNGTSETDTPKSILSNPLECYTELDKFYGGIWKAIAQAHPRATIPKPGSDQDLKARDVLAKLVRLDGFTEAHIIDVLRWLLRDDADQAEFWRGQVATLAQLRKKCKSGLSKFAAIDEARTRDMKQPTKRKAPAHLIADAKAASEREARNGGTGT